METADQQSSSVTEIDAKDISDTTNPAVSGVENEELQTPENKPIPIQPEDCNSPEVEPAKSKPDTPVIAGDQTTELNPNESSETNQKPSTRADQSKDNVSRRKEDDKLAMYKALAIKLKKELVKSREELTKFRESSHIESNTWRYKVDSLEKSLDNERQTHETSAATLEAKVRTLQLHLDSTELELQSLQSEFENYKIMASKIMQQNPSTQLNSDKTFGEERYKQLKELSDDQKKRISNLESQLEISLRKNDEFSKKSQQLQDDLDKLRHRLKSMNSIVEKCEILSNENNNLKLALGQFRSKLREPRCTSLDDASVTGDSNKPSMCDHSCNIQINENQNKTRTTSTSSPTMIDSSGGGVSPSASIKDESQTNSSSSHEGSISGYVHIKPATFEIISRSSVLDDAQNQIDNLTKAYLDSESTNSLLTEQVKALKEEIRRLQRGSERLALAENMEYLKNVVFKFLSLDSSQTEQKQRLIPVLSTVLKLSPDETAKLNTLTVTEKPSMASSFFRLRNQ